MNLKLVENGFWTSYHLLRHVRAVHKGDFNTENWSGTRLALLQSNKRRFSKVCILEKNQMDAKLAENVLAHPTIY